MEIEQQIWGATSEGEAVVLYTLCNAAGAEVRLCNVGAAVVSILVPDRDGHLADVALGYKDFRSYFGDPALCGKSIAAWPVASLTGRCGLTAKNTAWI